MRALPLALLAVLLAACAPAPPAEIAATQGATSPRAATPAAARAQAETRVVHFESLTFPGRLWTPFMPPAEEGEPATVNGILTLPAGEGRVPAVVIAHGCAGVTSGERGWAAKLSELGVAALVVHSLSSRRVPEVCTGQGAVNIASVLADAYRALDFLAAQPEVDPARIAILGLSFGGRTALWTSQSRFQERYGRGTARFAAHLAFYPSSCYIRLADEAQTTGAPIRIFHGAADDWTPIGQCKDYVARLREAGRDAALFEYAGARHAFDDPETPPLTLATALSPGRCAFVERDGAIVDSTTSREATIDAPCVTRGVSIGYSAEARRQALRDVEAVLREVFQLR